MSLSERSAGGARHTGGRRLRAVAMAARPAAPLPAPRRAAFAALLLALLAVTAPAAPAAAQEPCDGVTVVVDFGALAPSAAPAAGCAADPVDGLDALARAGFTVTEVASIRGMVCRIDELPETECGGAPPADRYWSYWHAAPGDDAWTYAMTGGAGSTPDAGDLEGWAFGDGKTPPALAPADAVPAPAASDGSAEDAGGNRTWLLAVAALAAIAALVLWRRRRDRRA